MSQRAADFPGEDDQTNAWKRFIAVVITYGICGTVIVLLLILFELVGDLTGTSVPLIGIAALALPALFILSTIWPNYKLAALGLTSFCTAPIVMIVSLMVLTADPDPSCRSCFIKMIQDAATIILILVLALSPWSIPCTAVARRWRGRRGTSRSRILTSVAAGGVGIPCSACRIADVRNAANSRNRTKA